jgi:hypothetical protein
LPRVSFNVSDLQIRAIPTERIGNMHEAPFGLF